MEIWFSDFVREGEYNSRIGWSFIAVLVISQVNRRWVTALMLLPFAIGGTFDIGYAYSFGGVFTTATMEAVAFTNRYEAVEYLNSYFSWSLVLLLGCLWLIYFLAIVLVRKPEKSGFARAVSVIGLIFVLVAGYRIGVMQSYYDTIPGVLGTIPSWYKGKAKVEQAFAARQQLVNETSTKATLVNNGRQQLHIFIIGESATRNHMGLYGYGRQTTPRLSAEADELIVMTDVISSHVQTEPSLRVALTEVSAVQQQRYAEALSVIDIANLAGYKTWWISNQQPVRATIASISQQADVSYYLSNAFNGVEVARYDGYMMDSIRKAIADPAPNKVVFIHTMGSHAQYRNRYPDDYVVFHDHDVNAYTAEPTDAQVDAINDYDNSILYTDSVLADVLAELKTVDGDVEASMTYFSDHGEEVFQLQNIKGHSPDNMTANMMEIPFVVWMSNQNSPQAQALRANSGSPFMLDNFYQYAVSLMNIDTRAANSDLSPAVAGYQPKQPRLVYGKSYEQLYQQHPQGEVQTALK